MNELSLRNIQTVGASRSNRWHPRGLTEWTVLEWSGALCGEAGELANVAKKIRRLELDMAHRAGESDLVELRHKLASECADVLAYLVLIAEREGIDLAAAYVTKFNQVSEQYGFPERLPVLEGPPRGQGHTYADLIALQQWAAGMMARSPDFVIGPHTMPYLRRWWVVPRNEGPNTYLHEILRSDDDRALHDHPWDNTSMIIEGRYIEHTPEGSFMRGAGWVGSRPATAAHRLEVLPGERAVTLFFTGPKVREWGFHCPNGWVPWDQFSAPGAPGEVGPGCPE